MDLVFFYLEFHWPLGVKWFVHHYLQKYFSQYFKQKHNLSSFNISDV